MEVVMRMGLREANQKFSKAIREVKAGRSVVLTERGTPIAVIQPLRAPSSQETALQHLRESGILREARVPRPMVSWKPVKLAGRPIVETLREERDER
jgi:prevent-host-death family protein